ncbi:coproporphyrinogen III oxidase [Pseudomonas sp. BAY1663]|nr:coproporphyrinogen III oxidase [Pseudomonas sp. BAY1663]
MGTLEGRHHGAHIALNDDMAMLALTMDLAEAMTLPMSVIWSAIRNWVDQGLV